MAAKKKAAKKEPQVRFTKVTASGYDLNVFETLEALENQVPCKNCGDVSNAVGSICSSAEVESVLGVKLPNGTYKVTIEQV